MSEETAENKVASASGLEALSPVLQRAYDGGDRGALAVTLRLYFLLGIPVPPWAQRAFAEACFADPKTWEDVLGPPPRPTREATEAFVAGQKLRRDRGLAVGEGLFEELAAELDTSPATAKRRYYNHPAFRPLLKNAWAALQNADRSGIDDTEFFIAGSKLISLLKDFVDRVTSHETPED
jgi:hypothetical protein